MFRVTAGAPARSVVRMASPRGMDALGSLDLLGGSSELARLRRPPGPLNLTARAPGIARRALMYELQNARHFYRQFHAAAPRL